jgi:hypothetical protein
VIGLHKFNGEQVFIVVDGLRYPAAYEPSSNTFLIYLYNTTSFNKIEAILYSKGAAIQRVEKVFKGENETGIFSGSAEEDAGQSGFVTGEQFLNITKKYPTTVMALVGFNDKEDADIAVRWYGKQGLRNIIKTACKNAEAIYKFNGIDIKFYALSVEEYLPDFDLFNGLYVGQCSLRPDADSDGGDTLSSRHTNVIGLGDLQGVQYSTEVVKETKIKHLIDGISYTLAHEYLHQWLCRSEYILYKNLLHMHNVGAHLNLKKFPNLNTEGTGSDAGSIRANLKEFWRIWEGHLFLLNNYNALCNESVEALLPELKVKLNTEKRKKEYLFRINNVRNGLDLSNGSDIVKASRSLNVGTDKVFSKEEIRKIIYNFQFN